MAKNSRQTLYQRIALMGEDEVRAGLKALGADGQRAFAQLQRSAGDTGRATTDLGKRLVDLKKGLDDVGARAKAVTNRFSGVTRQITSIGAAIVGAFSVRALVDMTNTWTDLNSQIRLVIDSGESVSDVMSRLGSVANRTYSDLQLTVEGFARNARVLNELGYSTAKQLDFQESLNNALVVSGARGQRAEQVTNSIAKAMATGTLRGEELNNVLSYGGRIAVLLAEHFNTTQGGLRQLAEQGQITGDVLFNVLVKNMKTLSEEAESMPATIADGFMRIRNALLQFIGTADESAGVSRMLADALIWVSENIEMLVTVGTALVGVFLLLKSVALVKDLLLLGEAFIILAGKIGAVTVALLANPLTVLPTLIAIAIAALVGMYIYWDDFRDYVNGVGASIAEFFSKVASDVVDAFMSIIEPAQEVFDAILGWMGDVLSMAGELIGAIGSIFSGGGGEGPEAQANAAGGHIRGPGTGTSDSILSWLSNGEYVIRAAAVRKYGLGLLNSLNSMRFSPQGFATGGLVPSMGSMSLSLPGLATGGPVVAGRPLSLTIGGETFEGLIAPEEVANKFVQFSARKKLASTGPKPGWVR